MLINKNQIIKLVTEINSLLPKHFGRLYPTTEHLVTTALNSKNVQAISAAVEILNDLLAEIKLERAQRARL